MKTPRRLAVSLISGLLTWAPAAARAQGGGPSDSGYDKHLAPASTIVAMRNDMRSLEQQLKAILPRPEHPGLERLAADIRHDVRVLEDQMREHSEGRHEGPVGGTAVVNWLRQRISLLRRDITGLPPLPPPLGR
jgi:hypothetical protein